MREILFRGKRVEEPIKINPYAPDGWVYGALIECDDGCFILPYDISGEMYIDRPYKFRANDVEARIMLAKVDTETVGQYTGLKDKNGTKIFEGDIVKEEFLGDELFVVKYTDNRVSSCGCCVPSFDGIGFVGESKRIYCGDVYRCSLSECEVVGNIHDNPELLEDE